MYPSETVRRVPEPSQPWIIRGSGVSEGYMAENIAPGKDHERKTQSQLEATPGMGELSFGEGMDFLTLTQFRNPISHGSADCIAGNLLDKMPTVHLDRFLVRQTTCKLAQFLHAENDAGICLNE